MTSVVELDIAVPQARLAELYANARANPEWMDDIARIEPVSGVPGAEASVYRLVPKEGGREFVATVVGRELPNDLHLLLEAADVVVNVDAKFLPLTAERTRLISRETFTFRTFVRAILGRAAAPRIRRAHRRHMDAFKRYAERLL